MTTSEKKLAYIAWVAICLIWGTTYLAIKICLETIPPALMGGIRFVCAAALLGGGLVAMGKRLPERRTWPAMALIGVLLLGFGNGGVIVAEQWVPSGIAAVLIGTLPFWMVGIQALWFKGEPLTWRHVAGLLVGFAGIVLLVWSDIRVSDSSGRQFLLGVGALQAACCGWAFGSVYSKRNASEGDPLGAAALQMFFGGAFMLVVGTIHGEWAELRFSTRTLAAFGYLVLAGSVVAFAAYNYALKHLPVSFVSLYAYVNPVVAVALGTVLLAEPFTLRTAIAVVVILAGVALVKTGGHT
ncbi:MAG: multidrug DMT transporter permease [Acidobacteria bacterium]|nr:MAG: multidrug DMT transporter permease [Acidobacteriota bacterium]